MGKQSIDHKTGIIIMGGNNDVTQIHQTDIRMAPELSMAESTENQELA